MENQIIIDGCNVAECEVLIRDNRCFISQLCYDLPLHNNDFCKDNPNCYFKQLQRAKAEVTHWSSLANEANERATEYGNECIKLEEEVRYYKELASDNEHNLRLAHQDYTDFIQKQKLKISELTTENDTLHISIEKLKGDLYIAEDSLKDYQEHYNKLEAENERLKKENDNLKRFC